MEHLTPSPVAIISGGAGFLGSLMARRLSADGFRVVILYGSTPRTDVDTLLFSLAGSGHMAFQADFRDHTAIELVVQKAHTEMGRIDVAIHAAESPLVRKQTLDTSFDEFVGQFQVGLFGGFSFLTSCARRMEDGGAIVGLTSMAIERGHISKQKGGYGPAKSALKTLLFTLGEELAPRNIRVHALSPSFLPGGLNSDLSPTVRELMYQKSAMDGKLATASDVENEISFLTSRTKPAEQNLLVLIPGGRVSLHI